MKKGFTFLLAIIIMAPTFAAIGKPVPAVKASGVYIPIDSSGQEISLLHLSQISLNEFEALTGQKMKGANKAMFTMAQKKLRRNINPGGTLNDKNGHSFLSQKIDAATGFHLGGFALGFYLGTTGVLIAYLINDGKKKNRVKWAWIGLGVNILLIILLVAVMVNLRQ